MNEKIEREEFSEDRGNNPEAGNEGEFPEKFQAVVVLGKGWRGDIPEDIPEDVPDEGKEKYLSLESKMSALAAGEMYRQGLADMIIFSTGKTAGTEWPSEAKAMKQFVLKKYPHIPEETILLEEESIDTIENAECLIPILDKHSLTSIALLTVGFHLERAEMIFRNMGIDVHGFPSEELLKERIKPNLRYKKFIDNFLSSRGVKTERIKEAILRALLIVDASGRIPRIITKRRHRRRT